MKKHHWLMILALALLVAPKLAAVVVQRQLEVEELRFDLTNCRLGLGECSEVIGLCREDLRYIIWREEQRRNKRRRTNARRRP